MIKINIKIIFLWFGLLVLLTSGSCSNEVDPNKLPTFDPITVDENTIFLSNIKDAPKVSKIYAIDTKNSIKLYTYDFKGRGISLIYDSSFDMKPYLQFFSGEVLKIETKTGKLHQIDIKYSVNYLSITNNKLWAIPEGRGFENTSKDYFTYDAKNDKSEYITLQEGMYNGSSILIKNNTYLSIFYDDKDILKESTTKIFNFTTNKFLSEKLFDSNKNYESYLFSGNYIGATYYDYKNEKYLTDILIINSFEPLDYRFLFTLKDGFGMRDVFEKDNFIYFILN